MINSSINKIVIIGPVLPFRGGIAHHTTMLGRALSKIAEVRILSFKRQYPAIIYPGKNDTESDYSHHIEDNTSYCIDSLNPLTWKKALAEIMAFRPEKIIIPWWSVYWVPCIGYLSYQLRKQHFSVAFFCHNVNDHESALWKKKASRAVLKNGSEFFVHSKEDKLILNSLLPDARINVHPHPLYNQFPPATSLLPRRRPLELLFFGFVRPYKGLDDLIDAVAIAKNENIQLTIAGEFWQKKEHTINKIKKLHLEKQIELRPYYHSENETAQLFTRADLVVLPYRSATSSGVIAIAYHYNKPVVATITGGLPEVVRHGETGFLVLPENPEALARILNDTSAEECQQMIPQIENIKQELSWDNMASTLLAEPDHR